ncbi:unnamed protein product [Urochloa humidicola]
MQLCCTQVLGYKLDELSDWKYSGGCTQVPRCCTQIRKDQVSWSFEVAGATVRDHWKKFVLFGRMMNGDDATRFNSFCEERHCSQP